MNEKQARYIQSKVDGSKVVVNILFLVSARRLCHLLEVATQTFETLHLVESLGGVDHRRLVIVIPVITSDTNLSIASHTRHSQTSQSRGGVCSAAGVAQNSNMSNNKCCSHSPDVEMQSVAFNVAQFPET